MSRFPGNLRARKPAFGKFSTLRRGEVIPAKHTEQEHLLRREIRSEREHAIVEFFHDVPHAIRYRPSLQFAQMEIVEIKDKKCSKKSQCVPQKRMFGEQEDVEHIPYRPPKHDNGDRDYRDVCQSMRSFEAAVRFHAYTVPCRRRSGPAARHMFRTLTFATFSRLCAQACVCRHGHSRHYIGRPN